MPLIYLYCRTAFRPQTQPGFAEPVAAERGARWSAGDGTELRLSDFSAKGWVAALDGGTAIPSEVLDRAAPDEL